MTRLVAVEGEGPGAGRLLCDDGRVFPLDGDYVIGREPTSLLGGARALRLTGQTSGISRHHARVSVLGRAVVVCDLGSVNGTWIRLPGDVGARPVCPGETVEIPPGTQIWLMRRSLLFEPCRRAR